VIEGEHNPMSELTCIAFWMLKAQEVSQAMPVQLEAAARRTKKDSAE